MTDKPRRTRTTRIRISVVTTLKDVAEQLGLPVPTVTGRYHRIQDAHPGKVVSIEALAESHKTSAHRGKYEPKPKRRTRGR